MSLCFCLDLIALTRSWRAAIITTSWEGTGIFNLLWGELVEFLYDAFGVGLYHPYIMALIVVEVWSQVKIPWYVGQKFFYQLVGCALELDNLVVTVVSCYNQTQRVLACMRTVFSNMYVPTTRTRITPRLVTSTIRTHTPTLGYRTLVPIPVCT